MTDLVRLRDHNISHPHSLRNDPVLTPPDTRFQSLINTWRKLIRPRNILRKRPITAPRPMSRRPIRRSNLTQSITVPKRLGEDRSQNGNVDGENSNDGLSNAPCVNC
ncbi:Uncharacterized protein HZ326_10684 [Fusarium oxysporum f. sp. albedinis]|nr:Uncharacterized protein HZ326_10684 [Fusarium oxysporum f. sp. albedinis]